MISDFALKRPVGSIVLSIIIILMGVVGYNFLGIRLYPAIDPPNITVQTSYTGANAEIIESQITEPLEKSINGIEGVKSITSQSSVGSSSITVEFDLGADLEKAANDVRDKVSQAQRNLPQDIDAPPTVTKADANSEPIIMLVAESSKMNALELSDYAENILQEKLQTIPGVSTVMIYGQQKPAMRLWFDAQKMASYGITPADVSAALIRENIEKPGGKIRGGETELIIKTNGRLTTEEEFNSLIIKQTDTKIIRMSDIGEAVLGPQNEESEATVNGVTGCVMAVVPMPGANTIEIADEFYKRLEYLNANAPAGTNLFVGRDKSIFVRQSIHDVIETLLIAISLVILIIYLFFRRWIIAIRPLIDIPVSLIGTFFVMYIFGFSVNVLTLLGIVLATGLVVDDGIVVTENIFKRLEKGMDKWQAAREGTREIFFAVISTSLTLAIVFIPVIFLEGFTGRLFREFGIVVSSAIIISAIVSLTLTPVLNVFLGGSARHGQFYERTEPFYVWLDTKYRNSLAGFMKQKWYAYSILMVCIIIIVVAFKNLKSELAPDEDQSLVRTFITLPEGTEYSYSKKVIDKIAQFSMDSIPDARYVMARTGGFGSSSANSGFVMTFLKYPDQREITQTDVYNKLSTFYKTIPEARVIASTEPTITTSFSRGLPVQYVLQNLDFEKLKRVIPQFMEEAQNSEVFSNVDINLKFNKPEINIDVDRLKASSLGVSEKDISDALDLAFSGKRYGYYLRNNKQYYIIGQLDRENRNDPMDISSLYVKSSSGKLIQLDNLVTMSESANPPTLYHYNRYKSTTFSANVAPGYTLGDGINEMQRIGEKLLDSSFETALSGPSRDFAESKSNISFALILALLLVFLVLAAQFESFIDPLIIMLTVPMAIAGALATLWIFGQTLNIFSEIGMLLLIGIVTKNGILIVEFANQKMAAGMDKRKAAFESAAARFRPILMTSLATIFGALPIALALGASAQSRSSLGIVVVGGLVFSLVLTLYVIPMIYVLMTKEKTQSPNQPAMETSI